jgi:hypothetical protein
MKQIMIAFLVMLTSGVCAQIFEAEGVNMPGSYNEWTNVPTNNAFANSNQAVGGRLVRMNHGQLHWQTIFSVAAAGADISAGAYEFKFSSGPAGGYWNNTWGDGLFMMNTLTTVGYGATSNNSISFSNDKWYTMNWMDNGYANTQAIFMETSAQPIVFSSVSQSPINGSVESVSNVTIQVTANAAPSAEELVYVRYSTNAFATSGLAQVNFNGTSGTATLPAQPAATIVQYYIFSTTINNPLPTDMDKVTIRSFTNNGGNFSYTVNSPLPNVNITFQVDMNQVTVDPSGVFIAGSFNGFSNQLMTNNGAGIYTYTASLPQNALIQYKYKNGSSGWEESIDTPCGNGTNRTLSIGNSDNVLNAVCFNSCSSCPSTHAVTFLVNMSAEAAIGDVYINGNFPPANWTSPQLMIPEGGGIFSYTVMLGAGNTYEYKFMNGSVYEGNLATPCGNGVNRIITIPTSDVVLPTQCYGYCDNCASCAVTFQVDMSQQLIDPSGVFIAGSFNGYTNTALTSAGGGLYSVTLNLQQGTTIHYKFKNGTSSWEGNIGAGCGDGTNRVLNVSESSAQTVPITCYGSCGACPVYHDITFAVNMAQTNVSFYGVHLAGNFGTAGYANWNASGINMSDPDGNGVYTATLSLPAGHSFEYKFVNGNDWLGAEVISSGCAANGNRVLEVPDADVMVDGVAYCFGTCSSCTAAVINDSPYAAVNVLYSSNTVFPNCHTLHGSAAAATDSPQSGSFSGKDVWYKFVAQSTGVSITLTGAAQDDALALYTRFGNTFTLLPGGAENVVSGTNDYERLNYSELTPGNTYYVSVGGAGITDGSSFTLCIQHLMKSYCNYAIPATGFNLCDLFKARYRGSSEQGVTYTFTFSGVGGGATGLTSITGSHLILLSNPLLSLRYGGLYDVEVDVNYALKNGMGVTENVWVEGLATAQNCSNVMIMNQPEVAVRVEQRCNALLSRGTFLNAARMGTESVCGASSYTYEFTQVSSCSDGNVISAFPLTFTTVNASPYLRLSALPVLGNTGAWNVRIRPNFLYGSGEYGSIQRIQVAGTAASQELTYEEMNSERQMNKSLFSMAVFPNPGNGDLVNMRLENMENGLLEAHLLDASGRLIAGRSWNVEAGIRIQWVFDRPLDAGIYMIEATQEGRTYTERLVVD